ncbi:unnamed protein product [Mortierella alpina]
MSDSWPPHPQAPSIQLPLATSSSLLASQSAPSRAHDDNPFLEPPARKLFRQGERSLRDYSTPLTAGHPNASQGHSNRPQRLVLTRVLPSNVTTRNAASSGSTKPEKMTATPSSSFAPTTTPVQASTLATTSTPAPTQVPVLSNSWERISFAPSSSSSPAIASFTSPIVISANTQPAARAQAIFSRSVLDFSKTSEPDFRSWNRSASHMTYHSRHQPPLQSSTRTYDDPASVSGSATNITPFMPSMESKECTGFASDITEPVVSSSSSPGKRGVFDLRAALRMDFSSRSGYQLPSLVASLSPPSSPRVRRPTPYTVPSAFEREALRVQRSVPQFKARPLNPKVFTGAGDLGVPRIQKQPLTIPVSPVFSRPRIRDAVSENEITKDEISTAAATRLKSVMQEGAEIKSRSKEPSSFSYSHAATKHHSSSFLPHAYPSQSSRSETVPSTATAAWTAPRIPVSSVRTAHDHPDLGHISGPPLRAVAPTQPTTSAKGSMVNRESKPVTRPVPFKFATTELQRKRRMFDSVYDMIAAAAATLDESDHVLK